MTIFVWLLLKINTGIFNKTVIFSILLGLYSLFLITYLSEKKTEENVKIQLLSYSTENDPTAEHLLLDMWPKISGDSILRNLMDVMTFENNDFDTISSYLHDKYFRGYWGNFNLNIVLCRKNDPLSVGDFNGSFEDCFNFFERKDFNKRATAAGNGFLFHG